MRRYNIFDALPNWASPVLVIKPLALIVVAAIVLGVVAPIGVFSIPVAVNFPVLALNDNLLAVVFGVVADPTAVTITG